MIGSCLTPPRPTDYDYGPIDYDYGLMKHDHGPMDMESDFCYNGVYTGAEAVVL